MLYNDAIGIWLEPRSEVGMVSLHKNVPMGTKSTSLCLNGLYISGW